MADDILFATNQALAFITLNRCKNLNALNASMFSQLTERLSAWRDDDNIKAVVVQSRCEKAFSAGGDIRALYERREEIARFSGEFFAKEYGLNALIHYYPKPYITLYDGLVMGGGVGISVHGSHPIATEKLQWAMPETRIGFFPDVGASFFLSRLPGAIGIYLGLTGTRINAHDALALGLVRAVITSHDVKNFVNDLQQNQMANDIENMVKPYQQPSNVENILQQQEIIDHCFEKNSVEAIVSALQQMNNDWSQQCLTQLQQASPLSLKITLQQIKRARALDFDDCMKMELTLSQHFMKGHDFFEGIRALLIDKDNQPKWQFARLEDVPDSWVDGYFSAL